MAVDLEFTPEQQLIRDSVRKMAAEHFAPRAAAADREMRPPMENIKLLADHGFTGMFLPAEYGGMGAGLVECVLVAQEIARACANTALLFSCTNGGAARAILQMGSDTLKKRYLPRFVTGGLLAAWSMSESDAGSDVGNVRTRATLDSDCYVINGSKLWCSGAQVAGLFLVLVRLNADAGMRGVGAVLVDRDTPGLTIGKHIDLIGLRATGMAELVFENCRIPASNLLVPAGGMRHLLKVLDADRLTGNPALCLGVAEAAFVGIVQHLKDRKQFGRPLADNQGLQWKIADMAMDIEAARALLYRAAERTQRDQAGIMDSSVAKVVNNEMAVRVTNMAMQLGGASGLAQDLPYERYFRDIRGFSIGFGTTEIHRGSIAREVLAGNYLV